MLDKLTGLYGEGEQKHYDDTSTLYDPDGTVQINLDRNCTIWHGENNTAIVLESCDNDYVGDKTWLVNATCHELKISYVKTDIADEIKTIDAMVANERVQTEHNTPHEGTDGL